MIPKCHSNDKNFLFPLLYTIPKVDFQHLDKDSRNVRFEIIRMMQRYDKVHKKGAYFTN